MSKRRQTIAACASESIKKIKSETSDESTDRKPISDLTDKELRSALVKMGETPGPIMPGTRYLYENLLEKHRKGDGKPKETNKSVSPEKPSRASKKPIPLKISKSKKKDQKSPVSPSKSPERLSPTLSDDQIEINTLPDPPADHLTNKQVREKLISLGETPGPINKETRKFYLELLSKLENGTLSHNTNVKKTTYNVLTSTKLGSPQSSKPMLPPNLSSTRIDTPRQIRQGMSRGANLSDYPDEDIELMDVGSNLSYVNTPYKKIRRSVCKADFEDTDFVIFAPSDQLPTDKSLYIDVHNNGVQAIVTQDCSAVTLVKVVKSASKFCKIYAGVTINSISEGKRSVSDAGSCGADAVVLSFAKYQCTDSTAIAKAITQVMEEQLTTSYFYYHNPQTKACPVQISKLLLRQGSGYQGIFISTDTINLLKLEELGIKIHETDSCNILRSLAHGIDSVASFEGIIAMPLMKKLKCEYYEGNTSECCRLQLQICSLVKLLTKYGDLLPSLHSALKLVNMNTGPLPTPLVPLHNEVPLLKELADMNIDKWADVAL